MNSKRLDANRAGCTWRFELQMTSMIDMVFLLLIFFMVTASFVQTERDMAAAVKVKSKSARTAVSNLEPAIIEVTRGGSGAFVYKLGGREIGSASELTSL